LIAGLGERVENQGREGSSTDATGIIESIWIES
jgi:hypothetical protein